MCGPRIYQSSLIQMHKFGVGVSCERPHSFSNVERASKISTSYTWSIMKNISELKEETCIGGRDLVNMQVRRNIAQTISNDKYKYPLIF